jgi:uncharacterized membrane protein
VTIIIIFLIIYYHLNKKIIMNPTHIHLLITHLPIAGSILGGIVLAYGLYTKSRQVKIAAFFLLIISSIGSVIAYLTGEEAEETVEKMQGVSKGMIEQHSDVALYALVSLCILGITAIAGLFLSIKKPALSGMTARAALVISLISFGLIAWTGYLGGQIRHTEITSVNVPQEQNGKEEKDND